jgi:DNA-binding IclR family transcriptional regulator
VPALGLAAQTHLLLGPATHAILVELMNQTTETAHLATPDKFEMVYLEKVESHWSVQASSRIGARAALYCTALGKAYLAFQPREVWAEYLEITDLKPHTPLSLISPSEVIAELVKVRKHNYALDNEENEPGVRCVAAPVLNEAGVSVAAISVMAPVDRLPLARVPEMGELVSRAAAKLAHVAAGGSLG